MRPRTRFERANWRLAAAHSDAASCTTSVMSISYAGGASLKMYDLPEERPGVSCAVCQYKFTVKRCHRLH